MTNSVQEEEIDILHISYEKLVKMSVLPTDMGGDDAETVLKDAGFCFLGIVETAPEFQRVKLPEEWRKEITHFNRRFTLVDHKGRKRAKVFYRLPRGWGIMAYTSIHMRLLCRFSIVFLSRRYDREHVAVSHVIDESKGGNDRVIFTTEPIDESYRYEPISAENGAGHLAQKWLDENYPNWRSPGAYWD